MNENRSKKNRNTKRRDTINHTQKQIKTLKHVYIYMYTCRQTQTQTHIKLGQTQTQIKKIYIQKYIHKQNQTNI